MALTVGWVALASLAVLSVAIAGGLWLDQRLRTRPAFTILLVFVSFPLTLLLITRVVRRTTGQVGSGRPENSERVEEDDPSNLKQT